MSRPYDGSAAHSRSSPLDGAERRGDPSHQPGPALSVIAGSEAFSMNLGHVDGTTVDGAIHRALRVMRQPRPARPPHLNAIMIASPYGADSHSSTRGRHQGQIAAT